MIEDDIDSMYYQLILRNDFNNGRRKDG